MVAARGVHSREIEVVGHDDRALGTQEPVGQAEQRTVHMGAVADEFTARAFLHEGGHDGPALALVDWPHRVEQVRHVADPGFEAGVSLRRGRVGMAHGRNRARAGHRPHHVERARELGRQRHLADGPPGRHLEPLPLGHRWRAQQFRREGPAAGRVDKRAFEVKAERFRASRRTGDMRQGREHGCRVLGVRPERAHQEGCHAVSRGPRGVRLDAARVLRKERLAAAAVNVDIDESGPHGEPGGVDDACARSAEIGANRHDPFALAQHVRPGEA